MRTNASTSAPVSSVSRAVSASSVGISVCWLSAITSLQSQKGPGEARQVRRSTVVFLALARLSPGTLQDTIEALSRAKQRLSAREAVCAGPEIFWEPVGSVGCHNRYGMRSASAAQITSLLGSVALHACAVLVLVVVARRQQPVAVAAPRERPDASV